MPGLLVGCGGPSLAPPAAPLTKPTALCTADDRAPSCRQAADVETWLRHPDLQILGAVGTPKGKQKALVLTLAVPSREGRIVFRAKWRADSTLSTLNDPRRELAAYAAQKLFLSPERYVVPPTVGHCFDLRHYQQHVDGKAAASFQGTRCVYGILSYWLENAQSIEQAADAEKLDKNDLFDETLFWKNAAYRRSLSDVNLLAHIISHGDSHPAQFVITGDRERPRVHLVDNTIAFSNFRNPRLDFKDDWSNLHVPAVSAESLTRLRELRWEDVLSLAAIERYENRGGRLLQTSLPTRPVLRPAGVRWVGKYFEIGLTRRELRQLWERVQALVTKADRGELRTF